jgi:cobalt-zinc-cadmium efflux system outer membrane protein
MFKTTILNKNNTIILVALICFINSFALDNSKGMKDFVSLVDYAIKYSPDIKKSLLLIKSAQGEQLQTEYLPNPQLDVEVENFGGSLEGSRFAMSETTFSISQKLETGGKRKFRQEAASYKVSAVKDSNKDAVNNKIYKIFIAYNNTVTAKKRLFLAKEMQKLTEKLYNSIKTKVQYGKSSPVDMVKASLELDRANLNLNKALFEFEKNQQQLAVELGLNKLPFKLEYKFLEEKDFLKDKQTFYKFLLNSPELSYAKLIKQSKEQELKLAKALNIPDIDFSVGYRKFRETDDKAYVVSLGIELPVFNRNKGLILQKTSERDVNAMSSKITETRLKGEFENAYSEMLVLLQRKNKYSDTLVPGARKSYKAVLTGYKEGKFNYLYMLDSMRTLIDVENEYLTSVAEFNNALGKVLKVTNFFVQDFLKKIQVHIIRGEKQ